MNFKKNFMPKEIKKMSRRAYKSIRKPMPPAERIISPDTEYNRADKKWQKEIEDENTDEGSSSSS